MPLPGNLCLKSYSLHTIRDLDQMCAAVRSCGLDAVDISGCHVDYQQPERFAAVVATLAKHGVRIVGNGVVGLRADPIQVNRVFAFARAAGSRVVSVHLDPSDYREAIAMACVLAEEHNMRVALHNHGGKHWHGSSQMLRHLLSLGSPRLGLCIDSAWALAANEDPVAWVREFGPRVFAAHLKDFTFDTKGRAHDVVFGHGALDLAGFVDGLIAAGFDGPLAIEYEGDEPDVTPAIRACVAALAPWQAVQRQALAP